MKPLQGIRVLITRPEGQGSSLASALEEQGAEAIQLATIAIAPPASFCALDAALVTLRTYDWLVFTSANAVKAFAARAQRLGLSANPRKIAVIGPATARAVLEAGIADRIDLQPSRFVAEALAEALTPEVKSKRILLVRAAVARDILPLALEQAGAEVTLAEAYRNVIPRESTERLRELFAKNPPDLATFTSASTVDNLAALLAADGLVLPEQTRLASIGPITSGAIRDHGWRVSAEAQEATIAGLVTAIVQLARH